MHDITKPVNISNKQLLYLICTSVLWVASVACAAKKCSRSKINSFYDLHEVSQVSVEANNNAVGPLLTHI